MFPFSTCALHPTEGVSPRITLASVDAESFNRFILLINRGLLSSFHLFTRVLFPKCFYFSIMCLARRLAGGFLLLCHIVLLSPVILQHQLCAVRLQFCLSAGIVFRDVTSVTQSWIVGWGAWWPSLEHQLVPFATSSKFPFSLICFWSHLT